MKSVNIEANPLVTKTIITSIDFQAPANDSYEDYEVVLVNFVDNHGKIFASDQRHVIRFIDAENGDPAWFEAYLGYPSRPVK
jgi:hypothetical protein